jgi:hypothetical protein
MKGTRFDGARFQRDLSRQNAAAWHLATRRSPDGAPKRVNDARLLQAYAEAPSNPALARAILKVQHLLQPEEILTGGIAA